MREQREQFRETSEQQLISLLKHDDRQAFNEIYTRFWEAMYRGAFSVVREEAPCKDILQEVFMDLWRRRETLNITHLKSYLLQAVRYQVAAYLKQGKLTEHHESYLQALSQGNTTEDLINYRELNKELNEVLEELPDKCKEVFRMSRFDHLSNKQIADKLEISQRTVEWHISNALKHLRLNLNKVAVLLLLCSCV